MRRRLPYFLVLLTLHQAAAVPLSHKKHNRVIATLHITPEPTTTSTQRPSSTKIAPHPIQTIATTITTMQPVVNKSFDKDNVNQTHPKLSKAADRKISSCFGKIKASLSLNPSFRTQFDQIVKLSRLDQIGNLIKQRIADLCTHEERVEANKFIKSFEPALQIVNEIYGSMTNNERDHLNMWSNLNASELEQRFYLAKFNLLPAAKYEAYNEAYNSIIGRLLNSTMKAYHSKFISQLSDRDLKQLNIFAREDEFNSIRRYIGDKLNNGKLNAAQRSEIENFFAHAFKKVSTLTGTRTRQYELKHESSYEQD